MIKQRLLSFAILLLVAFAQQQAVTHPYVHLADTQENNTQKNSPNSKQGKLHAETCGKCIALAGIGSAASANALTIHTSTPTIERTVVASQTLYSRTTLSYRSRAPPTLA